MKARCIAFVAFAGLNSLASGQTPNIPPPVSPVRAFGTTGNVILSEPVKPVVIDGKRASEMTDDELSAFLQSKILTIEQGEGELVLLRVAPGYALTLTFQEPVTSVIMGDPSLIAYERTGRAVILSAKQRAGDTNFKVLFAGGILREYHLFVEPNYVRAQSTVKVLTPKSISDTEASEGVQYVNANGDFDVRAISSVVYNYDALAKEGALDTTRIKRTDVFRRAGSGTFSYFHVYSFPGNVKAVSFSFRGAQLDASKLRLQIGGRNYLPDYVTFERRANPVNGTAMGIMLFNSPPFSLNQFFEITMP